MNERIKELDEQAHSYACEYARRPDYNPHNPYNEGMYKERYVSKFAELIVRDCMQVAGASHMSTPEGCGYYVDLAIERIGEHFGVEE